MRRWAVLALILCVSGCNNAPVAEFLDLVHPIHVMAPAGPPPDPLLPSPNVPVIPAPPPDPPPSGQLLPPTPPPASPPLPNGPVGSGFTPPSISNSGTNPLSIPNP
jgi:hypothetical protein